jgi:extracellular elastinolytic metalloproteinase
MSRELDIRDFTRNRATPQRAMELQSLAVMISESLPGAHRITIERLDPVTGNAAQIVSEGAPRTANGNFIRRALEHVRVIGPAMGVTSPSTDFVADSAIQVTSGARAVHLQQRYKGIPVFQAVATVRFAADGALQETTGRTVAVRRDASPTPKLPVKDAVRAAAAHVLGPDDEPQRRRQAVSSADLTRFEPIIRVMFTSAADQPTILEPGPFGAEIKANLAWLALDDQLVLGWNVLLTMRDDSQYVAIVDASSGAMLYCHHELHGAALDYSHSIVPGGLLVMS